MIAKHTMILGCCWAMVSFFMLSCKTAGSRLNQVVLESQHSMSFGELADRLSRTDIAAVTDLGSNRTAIVRGGRLIDSWNSVTGSYANVNFSRSRTRLGVFTLHAVEYCPPWTTASRWHAPCAENNRLGTYSLWFDDYIYGFHGRPEDPASQAEFDQDTEGRRSSRGCVVAPKDKLQDFIDLLFTHQNLKDHEGVKTIQDIRESSDEKTRKQNVFILLDDGQKNLARIPQGAQHWQNVPQVNAKLMVIDTREWLKTSSQHYDLTQVQQKFPFLYAAKEASKSSTDYRLTQDCTTTQSVPIYRSSEQKSEQHRIGFLNPYDLLIAAELTTIAAEKEQSLQRGGFAVDLTRSPSSGQGWIFHSDLQGALQCHYSYYWSQRPQASIIRGAAATANPSANTPCSYNEISSLLKQGHKDFRQSKAFQYLNCMLYEGGLGCKDKHSCSVSWHNAEDCHSLYRLFFSHAELSAEQQKQVHKICHSRP